jgi:8-hydroxy-5-deazaflavin:NADPH oxidoreductase
VTEEQQGQRRTIAIIGGTGKEGKGLAFRWGRAGHKVVIGSRQAEKAQAAADEVCHLLQGDAAVNGMTNPEAAQQAEVVVLTVPFNVHQDMLQSLKPYLAGKILVDVTVPLVPPKVTKVQMPPAGSASLEAQQIVGEDTQVVAAFQNISYEKLINDEDIECDVLVCGSSKTARTQVLELVKDAGLVGWDAGPLENSVVVEGLTSILIGLNKQFGVQSAGIRLTGIPRPL